ncbi:amidohydrolase [Bacillus mesophilus]|uniref:Amidohydrolase n=1 Tax=Bacillus mesophilus TaxID=1808955 RepID=A0A6M0QD20_9BACI|nr:M20 peptidase aminoacylase family protein [Bacillus mesophilus]MBM7663030.1 amidohydrolase [Bacillus mesophilus]NEY73649.1 amidohydrolase [Bacillus mesophilus]
MKVVEEKILNYFNFLHEHPELSFEEVNTTKYIESILIEQGCRVTTFKNCTGVIGDIGEGKPVVAVRADMDALWQEVDGEYKANHSCGHDAHMAMVLGIIEEVKSLPSLPKGTIRFIFQPAEEKGKGALQLFEEGVIDDVDYLFGVHLRPIQELPNGKATPAIIHGAARFIEGKIIAEDLHGARPHLGANAIEVGAALVGLTNGIHLDPMVPYSVKMTAFHAGGKSLNIIPGRATFGLDLRAQSNETMDQLVATIKDRIKALEAYYNVEIPMEFTSHIAAAMVNEEAQEIMKQAIKEIVGEENVEPPLVTTGGDDFHFYTIKRPHLKATMLGLGCDLQPGLHHPKMVFNQKALPVGTAILTKALLLAMEKEKDGERASY